MVENVFRLYSFKHFLNEKKQLFAKTNVFWTIINIFAPKRQKDKWLKMSSDSNQFPGNSDSDEGSDDGEAIEVSFQEMI